MEPKANPENPVRFGVFEADMTSGELRKSGVRLRLSGQPFQVLAVLLRNPGKIVSREDLKQELWPDDTFVDFENGVNTAIRKIRRVLDDSADTPRYVETLPRRGYRFIGQLDGLPQDGIAASQAKGQAAHSSPVSPSSSSARVAGYRHYLPWALFALTGLVLLAVLYLRQAPPEVPLRRFSITPPITIHVSERPRMVSISPGGEHIAFAEGTTDGKLWVQGLDESEPRAISHTEGAMGPFWSPDSQFIGFASGNELKRVAVAGGEVSRLCGLPSTNITGAGYGGGSWSPDGVSIVFASGGVIWEVPARGGVPETLVRAESLTVSADRVWGLVRSPHFLPSDAGRRVLVFGFGAYSPIRNMAVQDLGSGRREHLGPGAGPFYSPGGHLVYQPNIRSRTLMALPFSVETLKATGEAFLIVNDGQDPSVAADGTLVYLESPVQQKHLVWIDRDGNKIGEVSPAQRNFRDPDLSEDGQRVAVTVSSERGDDNDIWVYDLTRDSASPVTTTVENDYSAAWSPSGEDLAYSSNRTGDANILLRRSDGTGEEEKLASSPLHEALSDWSWDGKYLLFDYASATGADILYLERNGDNRKWSEPKPFLQTPLLERVPKLSPDGRYAAYVSDLSGILEVYVESFPGGGERVPISKNGGTQPRWSSDGNELFYVEGDMLMAVSVKTSPSFSVGETRTLFSHPTLLDHTPYPQYDVFNDGQRFILAEPVGEPPKPQIRVVQNWFAEFKNQQQD